MENEPPQGLIGPTLSAGEQPDPMPACGDCPKAIWYRTPKRTRAFCRELRLITWEDGESEPIMQCDGREAALAPANTPTR